MYLCDSGHDEVCYESGKCPACEMQAERDRDIEALDDIISDLKDEVRGLRAQLDELPIGGTQ